MHFCCWIYFTSNPKEWEQRRLIGLALYPRERKSEGKRLRTARKESTGYAKIKDKRDGYIPLMRDSIYSTTIQPYKHPVWAGSLSNEVFLPSLAFMSPLWSPFLLELRPGFRPRLLLTPELAFTDSSFKRKMKSKAQLNEPERLVGRLSF